MATPTGPRAAPARGWHARERRRLKHNQSQYAALIAAPHDFGSAAASAAFPNTLVLPADVRLQVEVTAASGAIPPGDTSFSDTIATAFNREDMANLTTLNAYFREARTLTITRGPAAVTGSLAVYFFGPGSTRKLIGTGTLT